MHGSSASEAWLLPLFVFRLSSSLPACRWHSTREFGTQAVHPQRSGSVLIRQLLSRSSVPPRRISRPSDLQTHRPRGGRSIASLTRGQSGSDRDANAFPVGQSPGDCPARSRYRLSLQIRQKDGDEDFGQISLFGEAQLSAAGCSILPSLGALRHPCL